MIYDANYYTSGQQRRIEERSKYEFYLLQTFFQYVNSQDQVYASNKSFVDILEQAINKMFAKDKPKSPDGSEDA